MALIPPPLPAAAILPPGPQAAPDREALVWRLHRALGRARRRSDYTFALVYLHCPGGVCGEPERVVAALQDAVRPTDLAARLASDGFGVLLHGVADEVDAFRVVRRLRATVARACGGPEPAGGVVFSGAAASGEVMAAQAEAAARAAAEERGGVAAYEAARHARAVQGLRAELELAAALPAGQLGVAYQPIVALGRGGRRLVGLEALSRWRHPLDGLLHPEHFVPAAERSGVIAMLDLWVAEQACARARAWLDAGVLPPEGYVSVNFSPRTLEGAPVVDRVLAALEAAALPGPHLQVEITETALVERDGAVSAALARLRGAGVRLVMDDFGSGFASLLHLQHLPLDGLKLDRSLLRAHAAGPGRPGLLPGVIALARCLALPVTVEGIETAEDAACVEALGADAGQGFHFAPPLEAGDVAAFAALP